MAPDPLPAPRAPLTWAAGVTLAEDLCTRQPLPAFDPAAMDGYAVAEPGPVAAAGWCGARERRRGAPGDWPRVRPWRSPPTRWCQRRRGGDAAGARSAGRGATERGPVQAPGRHIRRAGEDASTGA
ncbi:hypothetical protein [Streptomyces sp. NPDC015125]|uniref:hypothetical protein n=1 Tax=Streptomyces sp. NPDC015125 TaxID=3364938 RepID=UPI0036F6E660